MRRPLFVGGRSKNHVVAGTAVCILLSLLGCAVSDDPFQSPRVMDSSGQRCSAVEEAVDVAEQAQFFREAKTHRAEQLVGEIGRLKADLRAYSNTPASLRVMLAHAMWSMAS